MRLIRILLPVSSLLAVVKAATFAGCTTSALPHNSNLSFQIPGLDSTTCREECATQGFDYSFSYYWKPDQLRYCACQFEEDFFASREELEPAYDGEECFREEAQVYYLNTDHSFTHCAYSISAEKSMNRAFFETPGQCYEHCSFSSGVYILPPSSGVRDELYECICQQKGLSEFGISSLCGSSDYRRFDKVLQQQGSSRTGGIVFQHSEDDFNSI
ncbi:hypothetical protein I316_00875 [Kwoniella heveanensis BCC8398]|uniref:WSC domain-containing protein n=1 Tax=Kwoniella heveanensis BCC8398 TaxID=1296120 RepID=A0A1B9H399_9TREE|nr:hypothetical protein I316_00875 [Kwoniella heveanensis BCC8398]